MTAGTFHPTETAAGEEQEPSREYEHFRKFPGHDVVDPTHRLIGTISDVVFDQEGHPQWAVVDVGMMRSSHYLPVAAGYMSEAGEFVVPYDKKIVKTAPKADRSHMVDSSMHDELERHYELV